MCRQRRPFFERPTQNKYTLARAFFSPFVHSTRTMRARRSAPRGGGAFYIAVLLVDWLSFASG